MLKSTQSISSLQFQKVKQCTTNSYVLESQTFVVLNFTPKENIRSVFTLTIGGFFLKCIEN